MMGISRPAATIATVLTLVIGAVAPLHGAVPADEAASLVRDLAARIGLPQSAVRELLEHAEDEPEGSFWAITRGGETFTLAMIEDGGGSGDGQAQLREAALRRTQLLAATAAFFPEVRSRFLEFGLDDPLGQRFALRHLVEPARALALLERGAIASSDHAKGCAATVLVVPANRVRLIPNDELNGSALRELYSLGLRSVSRALMADGLFEEALRVLLELRGLSVLTTDDSIAVARCFSEVNRSSDAAVIISALLENSSLNSDELIRCGDIAVSTGADSLAARCYRAGTRAALEEW